jgi:hypothetical protein
VNEELRAEFIPVRLVIRLRGLLESICILLNLRGFTADNIASFH